MPKWEYLFVFASMTSRTDDFHPCFANNQELVDWQAGPTMYEYANQLGESGWELLACNPIVFTQSNSQPILESQSNSQPILQNQSSSSEIRAIELVFKRLKEEVK